jgi:hypothetical protein
MIYSENIRNDSNELNEIMVDFKNKGSDLLFTQDLCSNFPEKEKSTISNYSNFFDNFD